MEENIKQKVAGLLVNAAALASLLSTGVGAGQMIYYGMDVSKYEAMDKELHNEKVAIVSSYIRKDASADQNIDSRLDVMYLLAGDSYREKIVDVREREVEVLEHLIDAYDHLGDASLMCGFSAAAAVPTLYACTVLDAKERKQKELDQNEQNM